MTIPIILTAFGTTSRAFKTYQHIGTVIKNRFASHEVHWAYTSRLVHHILERKGRSDLPYPHEVLRLLKEKGHTWAVVQSLHLMAGHEFYRLVAQADVPGIRAGMGLPLLTSVEDYLDVINAVAPGIGNDPEEAVVLVSHGTDHPSWSTTTAFHYFLRERYGRRVNAGVIEGGFPGIAEILTHLKTEKYRRLRLIPFMLVAGVHFEEDMIGQNNSWKKAFESAGITVSVEPAGLGMNPAIVEIFCRHIQNALEVIPDGRRTICQPENEKNRASS